jgi:hypothetical protein
MKNQPPANNTLDLRRSETPQPSRWRLHRKTLVLGGFLVLMVVLAGLAISSQLIRHQAGVPNQLVSAQQTTKFPIYYPNPLPDGVSYVTDSVKATAESVMYNLTSGKTVVSVSVQPKPKGVVFDDFYTRVLKNKVDVLSDQGKAVAGAADGRVIGSLVTNDVWVLVNTPVGGDGEMMKQLVGNLEPLP